MMDCPHRALPLIMASTASNLRCSSASLNMYSVVSTCPAPGFRVQGSNAGFWGCCCLDPAEARITHTQQHDARVQRARGESAHTRRAGRATQGSPAFN